MKRVFKWSWQATGPSSKKGSRNCQQSALVQGDDGGCPRLAGERAEFSEVLSRSQMHELKRISLNPHLALNNHADVGSRITASNNLVAITKRSER
jgi:hypothetical protein